VRRTANGNEAGDSFDVASAFAGESIGGNANWADAFGTATTVDSNEAMDSDTKGRVTLRRHRDSGVVINGSLAEASSAEARVGEAIE
jgi:hypothetical protein